MKFNDEGYIVRLRKHGENSAILTVLTRHHGKIVGFVKNAFTKRSLGVFQLGNLVAVEAYARVDENMLSLKTELLAPTAVNFLGDAARLETLASFCELCNVCMPEQMALERLFYYVDSFFNLILEDNWIAHYAYFEFYLLDFLGISLDLSECSATGTTENLKYVSPKTGRAVCAEAGEPYKNRLFSFPQFVLEQNYAPTRQELKDLLKMTEFFLNKNFFQTHSLKFPLNRANLLHNLGF